MLWRHAGQLACLLLIAAALVLPHMKPVWAGTGGDRTLWLYHTHTHEEGKFTFRKNGRYDPKVLAQLDYVLRDWRNNKTTHMDPRLFDLLWTVYQKVGAKQPYHIVSSYRSPETNAFLRRTTSGVAKNSQHKLGKAMDVFIPGVSLVKLRQVAMQQQVGGVGYYPHSGSPFVHMDVGSVRAWPRMTTAQLRAIFPKGRTLHLPADGRPLSASGRQYAMVQWKECHTVPCSNGVLTGGPIGTGNIAIASAAPVTPPVPATRPDDLGAVTAVAALTAPIPAAPPEPAPVPATMSKAMMLAMRTGPAEGSAVTAIAALDPPRPRPAAAQPERADVTVAAYAPVHGADARAEETLQAIISASAPRAATAPVTQTATLRRARAPSVYNGLLDMTWSAVDKTGSHGAVAAALETVVAYKPIPGLKTREGQLVAPDLDHAAALFSNPRPMASADYARMTEPDVADFDPAAELGPLVNRVYFVQDTGRGLSPTHFVHRDPLHIASR